MDRIRSMKDLEKEKDEALKQLIVQKEASGVQLKKVGCIGLCALEPVIQILEADRPQVTYGKVTPTVAERIFQEHIGKGMILQEYVVENI